MKYRFGIIGLGMIAEMHARAIQDIPGAELVAGCDCHKQQSDRFTSKFGGTPYGTLEEFLAHPGLDIVTICTPSGLHRDCAVAAAEAGKHLIIEKPLEVSVDRCDAIIEAAEKHKVQLTGIFPSRFHEVSRVVKEAVEAGRLGTIVLADAYVKWYRSQEYYSSSGWKGTWALDGGGALMNQSIHAVDLLQWFMGPVSEIQAAYGTLVHEGIEVEDTAAAVLRFAGGAIGVIEGTTGAYPGFFKKIEITGSKGSIIMEEENLKVWDFADEQPEDDKIRKQFSSATKSGGGAADPAAIGYHGHRKQFEDMIRALETGDRLMVDGHEARKAVEIIQGIYTSAREGRPVKLPLQHS